MIFVGIDVASDKHDFFITNELGEVYSKRSITIDNSILGFKKLHKSITEFCEANNDYKVRIGLESTGFYHLNIIKYLLDNNFEVMLINPILTNMFKKSKRVHSAKTDNIDSQYICKYLLDTKQDFKPYTITSYHTEGLKSLSRERFCLVENLRKVKLSIYRVLTQLFPEYLKLFSNVYQGSALNILERYNSHKKLSRAHLDTIASLIHGKFKATNHRISKKGSKYLRYALWQVAKVCWIHDSIFNKYYLKKKAEHKHHFVILGHIEKKLVRVIYSILKNNTKYTSQ